MSSGKKKPDDRSYTAEEIKAAKKLMAEYFRQQDEASGKDPDDHSDTDDDSSDA